MAGPTQARRLPAMPFTLQLTRRPFTSMPWLKVFHIAAIIVWCGTLLYLCAALAVTARPGETGSPAQLRHRLLRVLFTSVVTPSALLAIASGSTIFLWHGPLATWLIIKLAVVCLLVLSHAACGILILRLERLDAAPVRGPGLVLGAASLLWLGAIAWLVLQKPV